MLDRFTMTDRIPSAKQAQWITDVYARLFDEPDYRNDWSAGKVPKGKDVPTPVVLQKLPLRPPKRG